MGAFVAVFIEIAVTFAEAVVAVAAAIIEVVSAITAALIAVMSQIIEVISVAIAYISTAITDFVTGLDVYLSGYFSIEDFAGTTFWTQVGAYVGSIYVEFAAVLSSIYFKLAMTIHDILYLISDDYRKLFSKLYNNVAKLGGALHLGAGFLPLVMRSSESLVLSVSSLMGRSYDLGKVTWLNEIGSFLKDLEKMAKRYQASPGQIFWDIDKWITKPYIDAQAALSAATLSTLEGVTNTVNITVKDLQKIRNDLGGLIGSLPASLRKEIQPYLKDVLSTWDEFIKTIYTPAMKDMNLLIDSYRIKTDDIKSRVDGVVSRLRKPVDYLKELDTLSIADRLDQEDALNGLAIRTYLRETGQLPEFLQGEMSDWTSIIETNLPNPFEETLSPVSTPQPTSKTTPAKPRGLPWYKME